MGDASQHGQHVNRPRPLPLFLDLVRRAGEKDPALAAAALEGLRIYQGAVRQRPVVRPAAATAGRARLLQCGDSGPPVILVPSLINPSSILDLAPDQSLLAFLGEAGFRALLLDWGSPDKSESERGIAGHVEEYLLPLIEAVGEPVHLVGYCLGGTMAIGAAVVAGSRIRSLSLLATPWHFAGYPDPARQALTSLRNATRRETAQLGLLPVEVLQTAFWSIDPDRTVEKFAALTHYAVDAERLARFVALEDWANDGAPLTAAAGHDLFELFVTEDLPGKGRWQVGGKTVDPHRLPCPVFQITAAADRIAPADTAVRGIETSASPAGHVGMIVGSKARAHCHLPLLHWLQAR
jgi:polyhydroxyalkanoate synthase subunit PhaC